jgi:hypothetical protein
VSTGMCPKRDGVHWRKAHVLAAAAPQQTERSA